MVSHQRLPLVASLSLLDPEQNMLAQGRGQ